uniref:Pentacotripeptide-repeat region of PRORP domain-containing protein n=1 Tax=Alexandrium catenella TaxID=2925 RepID=A0A7S1RNM7_ALECA|mmetsp:Transcript_66627/g.177453  ORF Transcript_66627/g.177453 Transcript_66627/m.177453 type:complete len:1009 (+) Transcript_66627:115-3141(+)
MALLAAALEAMLGVQTEIAIFLIALIMHYVLFGSYRVRPKSSKLAKASSLKECPAAVPFKRRAAQSTASPGAEVLAKSARELLRQGASRSAMIEELGAQVRANHAGTVCEALASMLEGLGKNAGVELVAAVREILREHGLAPTARLAELMLKNLLAMRLQNDFHEVLAETEAAHAVTPAIAVLAVRHSVASADLQAALAFVQRFAGPLKASMGATASSAPQQLMQQLLQLSAQQESVPALLDRLAACGLLKGWVLEAAFKECAPRGSNGSAGLLRELEELSRKHGVELPDAARAALVRAAGAAEDALRVFADAAGRGPVGKDLLLAALGASVAHRSSALAEAAVEHLPKTPSPDVASALLRSIAEGPLRGKDADSAILRACEKHLAGVDLLADARTGRLVAEVALRRKRPEVLEQLLRSTTETPRLVGLLKGFATERRLADAEAVFRACPGKTASLYNSLLDACIDCQDMELAERTMAEAVAAGVADVVTYNTIIKKHLQHGHFERARAVIETMRSAGGNFAPNSVTFNELIDATIRSNSEGVWMLIDEMRACGLQPTTVTGSILLKAVQRNSRASDVERTLAFVGELEDAMDEVLLSSVCEACIRACRADLLGAQLRRQRSSRGIQISGAHTFGSVIRAYGFLRDLEGAWDAWTEMRSRRIVPTSITIGCMVEAVVTNGDVDGGYELVASLLQDPQCREQVNAVVFGSVLKGYGRGRNMERLFAVFEEMLARGIEPSVVTFNAMIDACARNAQMDRVPDLLACMRKRHLAPNLITYGTMIKGFAQQGDMPAAFSVMKDLQREPGCKPDEVVYNTLLDGCLLVGLPAEGERVFEEMQKQGVPPSNYTLTVLVKLLGQARQLDRAFALVDGAAQRYRFRLNSHALSALVQACLSAHEPLRAVGVCERAARERQQLEPRACHGLVRALLAAGHRVKAASLLRSSFGVSGCAERSSAGQATDDAILTDCLQALLSAGDRSTARGLLRDVRAARPKARIDPALERRVFEGGH